MSKKLAAKARLIQLPPVAGASRRDHGDEGEASPPPSGHPAQAPDGVVDDTVSLQGATSTLHRGVSPGSRSGAAPFGGSLEARTKTAPGAMAHFMMSQSAAVKEAEDLRARLKVFDGATPVLALDPRAVRPSRWANRHEDAYADTAFAQLKAEVASAGGNVQPVSVRRLWPAAASEQASRVASAGNAKAESLDESVASASLEAGQQTSGVAARPHGAPTPVYELVYGHRRHRACLELGIPVLAMVVDIDDQALFEAMERENRARKNLSAWEQGCMYKRALDEGLYPSQRRLSEALGVDVSLVSKSLSLARLPAAVIKAFASPLDIQFRWAQPLADALQRDPDGVLRRATQLKRSGPMSGSAVLAQLIGRGEEVLNRSTPTHLVIQGAAGRQAVLTRDAQDRVALKFPAGALSGAAQAELAELVEALLSKQ